MSSRRLTCSRMFLVHYAFRQELSLEIGCGSRTFPRAYPRAPDTSALGSTSQANASRAAARKVIALSCRTCISFMRTRDCSRRAPGHTMLSEIYLLFPDLGQSNGTTNLALSIQFLDRLAKQAGAGRAPFFRTDYDLI